MTGATELFVVLLVVGLLLVTVELFIPGGVLGALGAIALVGAVIASFFAFGARGGFIASATMVVAGGLVIGIWLKFFPRTGVGRRITLASDLGQARSAPSDWKQLEGQVGTAQSDLRPSGVAWIGGRRVDVVAEAGFVPKGATVQVVRVDGFRIVVRGAAA